MSVSVVQCICRKHGIKPPRLERRIVSNDPDFETIAADVIVLYLNPPTHAAVVCLNEKTAIRAFGTLRPAAAFVAGACRKLRLQVRTQRSPLSVRGI